MSKGMKLDRDGFVHLSDLKTLSQSPAHYLHRLNTEFTPTPAMQFGTLVDMLLFDTGKPCVYEGARRGRDWDAYKAQHEGEFIATRDEYERACACVMAVQAYEPAAALLDGARFQVPLEWEDGGIKRRTRGLDILNGRVIADLKVTQSTEPIRFQYQARRMWWHAQLADYAEALRRNGIEHQGLFLLGVEPKAPHCVTVLKLTREAEEEGRRAIVMWTERYRSCRDAEQWPGYVQTVVEMEAGYTVSDDDNDSEDEVEHGMV